MRVSARRSTTLIANFLDGYADGWFMAVRECFREQLDIKYTDRIKEEKFPDGSKKKRRVAEWTQGPCFCFGRDHIFYDTSKAYLPWSEALQHINLACKIIATTPNELIREIDSETGKGYYRLSEGWVKFNLLKPNPERTGLVSIGEFELTQNSFVHFLKTGYYDAVQTHEREIPAAWQQPILVA